MSPQNGKKDSIVNTNNTSKKDIPSLIGYNRTSVYKADTSIVVTSECLLDLYPTDAVCEQRQYRQEGEKRNIRYQHGIINREYYRQNGLINKGER